MWTQLELGFLAALQPENLLFCFIGVFVGTLIGVLPGLGPVSSITLLVPFTFSLSPTSGLIMLAGIYYGSMYGSSTTAILVNLPGEPASAVTCLDGHAMARQGRAGLALAVAAVASCFAGIVGTALLAFLSGPLAIVAATFEAADYTMLIVLGIVAAMTMTGSPLWKSALMVGLGLALSQVGTSAITGEVQYTFGIPELIDGIGFIPLGIGLLGVAEIIHSLGKAAEATVHFDHRGTGLRPGEGSRAAKAATRGTLVGAFLGILPGAGPVIASFIAYTLEKRIAKDPALLGHGQVEGVAAPEAANNAAAQSSFIPLLTLGLPANPVMVVFVGALMIHGVQPGPDIIQKQPALFWALVASMWIGNALLLLLNLPLVALWAKLLRLPRHHLLIGALVLSCVGVYSLNHSAVELLIMALFGALGFALRRSGFEPTPLLLGFVLGPSLQENWHRSLIFANGDLLTFVHHPIALTLLIVSVALLVVSQPTKKIAVSR